METLTARAFASTRKDMKDREAESQKWKRAFGSNVFVCICPKHILQYVTMPLYDEY